jgi:hypothetical protein
LGSFKHFKKTKRKPGKVETLLNEKLQNAEWGEFKLGEIFEINTYKKRFDANKVEVLENGKFPYIVRTSSNNGIKGYIDEDEQYLNDGNTISFGQDTATMFYQEEPYFTGDKIKILKSKFSRFNKNSAQFFILTMTKSFSSFSWGSSSFSVKILENIKIQLPSKNGKIDFDFMENFITELETERINKLQTYLIASGLNDYHLTLEEEKVLKDFENGNLAFGEFAYKNIFNKILQGRRLKKDDQKSGIIPFVMAGTTNTGVVNYISNPVASFPKNSITIDIFGNTFYRNYDFGAGDDTGVYFSNEKEYSKEVMLFFTTSMEKSISGKFDFGNKLRSSQSLNFKMKIPISNKKPDFVIMETFISAIQKLVIKDVVLYVNKKING